MPSSTSLKKILTIKCSNNISFRSSSIPPYHCSANRYHPFSFFFFNYDLETNSQWEIHGGKHWGEDISAVLALQWWFSVPKTQMPQNEDSGVWELTCLVSASVPFPKPCLHSLTWNAAVYSTWCICEWGSSTSAGCGVSPHPIHLHMECDTDALAVTCRWASPADNAPSCLIEQSPVSSELAIWPTPPATVFDDTPKYSHIPYIIQYKFFKNCVLSLNRLYASQSEGCRHFFQYLWLVEVPP